MPAEEGRPAANGAAGNRRPGQGDEFAAQRTSARQPGRATRSTCSVPRRPETFGLTDRELHLEALTLLANGWSDEEIHAVLALPRTAAQ